MWVVAPVWTALYLMMPTSAWRVWRRGGWAAQQRPLALYLVQIALNAAWTPLFFGAHAIGLALVEILALWIAILLTLLAFDRVSRPAAALLLPYWLWVGFASWLNFTLWRLNS